jgi:CheY-like chemotaxis protein
VDDVARLYTPQAGARGTSLKRTIGAEVPRFIRGDALRLRQVLSNLVGNAVKFTSNGSITLTLGARGDQLRFEVTDTGVGIAPEAQASLFKPFQQGDASTTRRFGGTGLGLALARELVLLMRGSIGVSSKLGEGATFWFQVPCVAARDGARAQTPLPQLAPATAGQAAISGRVLVVDDNEVNLLVARALVERAGCEVEVARDGLEAVRALESSPFALVLMDCQMPVLDGFEATRRIRQLPGEPGRTPVVALTASAMPEELAECRRAGMDDCLTKPLVRAQLERVLKTWLRAPVEAPRALG